MQRMEMEMTELRAARGALAKRAEAAQRALDDKALEMKKSEGVHVAALNEKSEIQSKRIGMRLAMFVLP